MGSTEQTVCYAKWILLKPCNDGIPCCLSTNHLSRGGVGLHAKRVFSATTFSPRSVESSNGRAPADWVLAMALAVTTRSLEDVARMLTMEPLSTVLPVRLVSVPSTRLPFLPTEYILPLPAVVPIYKGPDEPFLVPNRELPPPIPIPMLPLVRQPMPMELPVRELP